MLDKLILKLWNANKFKPLTYNDIINVPVIKKPNIDEVEDLCYEPEQCVSDYNTLHPEKDKNKVWEVKPTYWFADFEAEALPGKFNREYTVCLSNEDGSIQKTFKGPDCSKKFMDFIVRYFNPKIYFHSLGYDSSFLAKFGIHGKAIQKSQNKRFRLKIRYKDVDIELRDSLALINHKLEEFPGMFKLEGEKEAFPYQYYTLERLEKNVGNIKQALKFIKPENRKHFIPNIDKVIDCRINESEFDMYKYCEFYCRRDVELLRDGFKKFREMFKKEYHIDVYDVVSAPTLAFKVLVENVLSKNSRIKCYSGKVNDYIRRAIYGGRCMSAYNKAWFVKMKIFDSDARSLYPSAMSIMSLPLGAPKVLQPNQLNFNFLKQQDAHVVTIKINTVNKHRAFPLIPQRKKEGVEWNDYIGAEGLTLIVDDYMLEDLIEFQQIEFEIIRGYYWNEGLDTSIQALYKEIYAKRRKYKDDKDKNGKSNPLQEVHELLMNSSYGKTIQKDIETETKYMNSEDTEKIIRTNYNLIVEDTQLADSDIHQIKYRKSAVFQFTYSLIGVKALSMSKRIMNRVMCLAEDMGCLIFYQDTDSMHIRAEDVPLLAEEFKKKYGYELIGKELTQFHSDFDEFDKDPNAYSDYLIINGKKHYIDRVNRIEEGKAGIKYHVRCKGVTTKAIEKKAESINLLKLYRKTYYGESVTYDLVKASPRFVMGKDFTIFSKEKFLRNVRRLLDKGDLKKYVSQMEENRKNYFKKV